jgi:uncharacterized surface protein with fasciclin (FAS1) repeats/heme/copper-type cytochrome/quinol oxidase subunit 2
MRRTFRLTKIAALALAAVAITSPARAADIIETIRLSDQLKRLGQLIETGGLADTLKGEGPFTIFAPSDAAFEALGEGTLDQMDQEQLRTVLRHHVVEGQAIAANSIPERLESLSGEAISVFLAPDGLGLQSGDRKQPGESAAITGADIKADNGIIHVIDAVLVPEAMAPGMRIASPLPGTQVQPAAETPAHGHAIPYQGPLPPEHPNLEKIVPHLHEMQKPLKDWEKAALDVLYQRPSPQGPEPIPVSPPKAISVVGKGPVVQILPGPAVYPDKIPERLRTFHPIDSSNYSNNTVELERGEIRFVAIDRTLNDSKLSGDEMGLEVSFTDHEGNEWRIVQLALAPISTNVIQEPWWGGVTIDTPFHGHSGHDSPLLPLITCAMCSYGWADVWKNGVKVGSSILTHIMLSTDTRDDENDFHYRSYDSTDQPIRQVHLEIVPQADLPSPGGFLHVTWENAEIRRGSPDEFKDELAALQPDMPTVHLKAVEHLEWSDTEIHVEVGQPIKLVLTNDDPASFHAFTIPTQKGAVHVPLPQGTTWVTSLVFDQPGEYRFECPVANHAGRGMYGRIIVGGGVPGGTVGPSGTSTQAPEIAPERK